MEAWSCTKIAAEFSDVKMRIEYADAAAAAAAAGHQGDSAVDTPDGPDDLQRLGNLSWIDVKAPNGMPPGSAGPEFAPWYWDIKDGDPRVLARIQNLTQLPAVLRADSTNIHEVLWSPEIWFSPPRGGAKAHADEHCEATVSIQLSGTKRWRLSPFPTVTASNFSMQPSLADGVPLLVCLGLLCPQSPHLVGTHRVFLPIDLKFKGTLWLYGSVNLESRRACKNITSDLLLRCRQDGLQRTLLTSRQAKLSSFHPEQSTKPPTLDPTAQLLSPTSGYEAILNFRSKDILLSIVFCGVCRQYSSSDKNSSFVARTRRLQLRLFLFQTHYMPLIVSIAALEMVPSP